MKNLPLLTLLLTSILITTTTLPILHHPPQSILLAQTPPQDPPPQDPPQAPSEFSYRFYDQNIPLTLHPDQIAVEFKPQPRDSTRGNTGTRGTDTRPHYLKLQDTLQNTLQTTEPSPSRAPTRSTAPQITVQPLGTRYALITLPKTRSRSLEDRLTQSLEAPYITGQLPVFQRPNQQTSIVLPNEIVVSVEPDLSPSQTAATLDRFGLDIIRPLRFSQNKYLVKSRKDSGTHILRVAQQLTTLSGIQSATPNFVQSVAYGVNPLNLDDARWLNPAQNPPDIGPASAIDFSKLTPRQSSQSDQSTDPAQNPLLALAWHLDSRPLQKLALPRTDVHATEAWEAGQQGQGTVVAVIDSLIQWDHPDLAANLYTLGDDVTDKLPGETQGWDFTEDEAGDCDSAEADDCSLGDPDTRISETELEVLRSHFQNTFALSDEALLATYEEWVESLRSEDADLSDRQIANLIRNYIRDDIAGEFHGTWSAGVIAASPASAIGAVGVAPKAKILPVRVFGLGGSITSAGLIEAIGYAAERGADVINMSLGSLLPDQDLTDQVFSVLDKHPNLVIVAAAGNENLDGVGFPAAIPGVVSVGATNLAGQRTSYSSFGGQLDVVAPGGDQSQRPSGGILTTGGTGSEAWWQGIDPPKTAWGPSLDPRGQYVQVQGTSFSAPTVAGVLALMRSADLSHALSRQQLLEILQETASYSSLRLTQADKNHYRLQKEIGFGTVFAFPLSRPSGIHERPEAISPERYYFGWGLVNAAAAVEQVLQRGSGRQSP